MGLRERTISGAKWSAMATVVIIGLGLAQMTVLARLFDGHQFGLLTISASPTRLSSGRISANWS